MKKTNSLLKKFESINQKEIAILFLGVGTTMFVLSFISYLTIYQYLKLSQLGLVGPFYGHYTSFVASILLMAYAIYELHKN